ncbi:MAG: NAD-glutamate dehydrogenase [Myxococcota bacterium]
MLQNMLDNYAVSSANHIVVCADEALWPGFSDVMMSLGTPLNMLEGGHWACCRGAARSGDYILKWPLHLDFLQHRLSHPDRVEEFVAAVDAYDPQQLDQHEDAFRVFARFISRSIDGRYLERHQPAELLPDLEHLMASSLVRTPDEIKVRIVTSEGTQGQRGVIVTCMDDQPFLFSTVRLSLAHLGVKHYRYINSIIPIRRNAQGEITHVGSTGAIQESFVWMEIEAEDLHRRKEEIECYIQGRLEASRAAVRDFPSIKATVQALARRITALARVRPGSTCGSRK